MRKECVICHYGEIGTKGKNRSFFEKKLVSNIGKALPDARILSPPGRVVVFSKEKELRKKLKRVFGISYFSFARIVPSKEKEIEREVLSTVKEKDFTSFRITVRRSCKDFPLSSMEFAAKLGEKVQKEVKKKVDLENPDLNTIVEITPKETYIYTEKIKGAGGLPVGVSGKVVSLLSGGIDSPVSSFLMAKRGAKNVFVHFHAYPSTSKESIEKAKKIVEILSLYQGKSVLYLVPFDDVQKEVVLNTKDSTRVLIYRRLMMRIAKEIAKKEKAKAASSGESLGQVASQTLENIAVTDDAIDLPVLRPLAGFDKEEIIKIGKEIGTYETSILPEEDCCVRFLPKKPETKGSIPETRKEEENLDVKEMVKRALDGTQKSVIGDI